MSGLSRASSRSQSLAPDVKAPTPESDSATETEEAVGNSASVDAMDVDTDDGGGSPVLDAAAVEAEPAAPEAPARPDWESMSGKTVTLESLQEGDVIRHESWGVVRVDDVLDRGDDYDLVMETLDGTRETASEEPWDRDVELLQRGVKPWIEYDDDDTDVSPSGLEPGVVDDRSTVEKYQGAIAGGASRADAAMGAADAQGMYINVRARDKGSDTYLRRIGKKATRTIGAVLPKGVKDKTWDDARDEFAGVRSDGAVAKRADKFRKMMVRGTTALDEYVFKMEQTIAMADGAAAELGTRRTQQAEALAEALDAAAEAGSDEESVQEQIADTKTALEDTDSLHKTFEHEAAQLRNNRDVTWGDAETTYTRSQEVVSWHDQVQAATASKAAEVMNPDALSPETSERYAEWVEQTLGWQATGQAHKDKAVGLQTIIFKSGLHESESGWMGWVKDKAAAGMGAAGQAAASYLTAGIVGVEARDVEGGRKKKRGVNFGNFVKEFRRVKAECAEIEATGTFGEHAGLYNGLKMLSDFGLPLLRTVSNSVGLWGVILAPATAGASLGVAAGAGTISLLVTALKGVIELALTLWSAKAASDHTDRDARKLAVAQAERRQHGVELAKDAVSTGMMGTLATTKAGDSLGAGKALRTRFSDFDNSSGVVRGKADPFGIVGGGVARGAAVGAMTAKKQVVGSESETEHARRARRLEQDAPLSLGLGASDRFLTPGAGPAPAKRAPAAPSAAGPAPDHPAPAPPTEAAEADKGKPPMVGRAASKLAGALLSTAGGMASAAEKAKDDKDAGKDAGDVQTIADDMQDVVDHLPR